MKLPSEAVKMWGQPTALPSKAVKMWGQAKKMWWQAMKLPTPFTVRCAQIRPLWTPPLELQSQAQILSRADTTHHMAPASHCTCLINMSWHNRDGCEKNNGPDGVAVRHRQGLRATTSAFPLRGRPSTTTSLAHGNQVQAAVSKRPQNPCPLAPPPPCVKLQQGTRAKRLHLTWIPGESPWTQSEYVRAEGRPVAPS